MNNHNIHLILLARQCTSSTNKDISKEKDTTSSSGPFVGISFSNIDRLLSTYFLN